MGAKMSEQHEMKGSGQALTVVDCSGGRMLTKGPRRRIQPSYPSFQTAQAFVLHARGGLD